MHQCSKLGYVHYTEAARVAKRMRHQFHEPLQAFRCERCRLFHVGNPTDEERFAHKMMRDFRLRCQEPEANNDYRIAS